MPYKDAEKKKEYHRDYYKKYMKEHMKYRHTAEKNRSENHKSAKENGIITYKLRRFSRKYGKVGVDTFLRDDCSCVKCGATDFRLLVLDHIVPKSREGTDGIDNLQTLCYNCHALKHFMEDVKDKTVTDQLVWDTYWMLFAKSLERYSNCLSRHIGAVLVRDNRVLSVGWNNTPNGIKDCSTRNLNKEKICPRKLIGARSGERLDLCIAMHAEASCIISATKHGKCTNGATLYANCGIPCKDCLITIINSGVNRVVCNKSNNYNNTGNFGVFYDELSKYLYDSSELTIDFVEV